MQSFGRWVKQKNSRKNLMVGPDLCVPPQTCSLCSTSVLCQEVIPKVRIKEFLCAPQPPSSLFSTQSQQESWPPGRSGQRTERAKNRRGGSRVFGLKLFPCGAPKTGHGPQQMAQGQRIKVMAHSAHRTLLIITPSP